MGYAEEDSNKISSRERRRQRKNRHDSEDEVSEIESEREERRYKKSKRKNDEDKEYSSPDRRKDKSKRDKKRDTIYGEERKKAYDNDGYDENDRGKPRKKKRRRRDEGKVSTIELKHFNDSSLKYDATKQEMNGDLSHYFKSFFEPEYSDDVADRIAYIKRRVSTSHQCYKFFLKFCRVIQGLLAGICLWEVVVIYGGGMPSLENFITFYSPIAVAFQATYSVFIALCLVFVGDRLVCRFMTKSDIDPLPLVWRIFSWTTLAGLVYFIGFVLSLVQAPVDLSIHLAVENVTHWLEYTDNAQTIRSWKIGTLFRCLCGILAFIFITFEPAITFS